MSTIPPPEEPGWYADAEGAWWWWDGRSWTSSSIAGGLVGGGADRDKERTNAVLMWILYLVLGGWLVALIFYLISKEKPFTRHHSAEALNLSIVLLVPQVVGFVLLVPGYIDLITAGIEDPEAGFDVGGGFWAGLAVLGVVSLLNYGFGILGAVRAHRGSWDRLPIGIHPVRGVLKKGEAPPFDVTS